MADFEHEDFTAHPAAPTIPPDPELPEDLALMSLLQELGASDADAKVSVYRVQPGTRKVVYVQSYLPEEFSLDRLQVDLGAGDYRVQVRSGTRLRANKLISVDDAPGKAPEIVASITPQSGNDAISKLAEMMAQGFSQLGQIMAQTAQRPQIDPESMRRGMMQDMLMMKQLFDRPAPENGADKAIEMLMKGMELAKEINPSDRESGPMDVVMEALKSFAPTLAAAANQPAPVQPAYSPVPFNPPPETAPQMESPDMNVKEMAARQMLRPHVNFLLKQAIAKKDPALYADLIIDQAPDELLKTVITQTDDEVLRFLTRVNHAVQEHGEWFTALLKEMRLGLTGAGIPASVEGMAQPRFIIPDATDPHENALSDPQH